MKKPNLFIVGAARSGTTSLWRYLSLHPDIYMPEDELGKEPTFFSDSGGKNINLESYLSFFSNSSENHKWVGEASVAYLTDPESAKNIFEFNPEARIIITLRNPVDRAYSLYNWMVQDGYEYSPSFQHALDLEEVRVHQKSRDWYKPNYHWGYLYFRSGLYYQQVEKYIKLFGDKVFIINFENLVKNPGLNYQHICSFLNIKPNAVHFSIYNPSYDVFSAKVLFILRKLNYFIISQNRNGVPVQEILGGLENEYNKNAHILAKMIPWSFSEKIWRKVIFKKVLIYLSNIPDQFLYQKFKTKEERDRLLKFGIKKRGPKKLKKRMKFRLLNLYEADIKKLSELTKIDFLDWLEC